MAVLLLLWLLLGWLLPALLLLPEAMAGRAGSQAGHAAQALPDGVVPTGGEGSSRHGRSSGIVQTVVCAVTSRRVAAALEAGLRTLLPPARRPGQSDGPNQLLYALLWWGLVQVTWGICCVTAPLFVPR